MKTTTRQTGLFLALTFLFSWLVWGLMLLLSIPDQLFLPLLILGAFGPSLSAVYLLHRRGTKEEIRSFWLRTVNLRQIGWGWFLLILVSMPAIYLLGYYCYSFFDGLRPPLASLFAGLDALETILIFSLVMLLGGPVSEELGWRGYLLQPLEERFGFVKGNLLVGICWTLWHLPLFFIEGTSQYAKGFGIAFWSWAFQLLFLSFFFSWVYHNTKRSILAAVLLHLMANLAYPTNLPPEGELVFTLFRLLFILLIVFGWHQKANRQMLVQPTA